MGGALSGEAGHPGDGAQSGARLTKGKKWLTGVVLPKNLPGTYSEPWSEEADYWSERFRWAAAKRLDSVDGCR
jgi:hypothetical protein